MRRFLRGLLWLLVGVVALQLAGTSFIPAASAQDSPPPPPLDETGQAINQALQQAVSENQQSVLGFMIGQVEISQISYSDDGQTALLWLVLRDAQTGQQLGKEPGLAVARNLSGESTDAASWQITLQSAPDWQDQLKNLPVGLLSDELRALYLSTASTEVEPKGLLAMNGYKLPWAAGNKVMISGSVGHFLDYHSCAETACRYAYDFANGSNFPLLAAKGGKVVAYTISCENNDHNCTNYLTLQDDSTTPTSYQLYYHLAHDSIPANVRKIGAQVVQGQFIGDADNTGYSSGSHLHFHVYLTPTWANYFWGNSVDITFDDVSMNGGRPRTCFEAINHSGYGNECSTGADGKKGTGDDDWLTSGNQGSDPPTGQLNAPAAWTTINTRTMDVSGTAHDNIAVTKVQILANINGTWNEIALADINSGNGTFSKSVDLCSVSVPDGPFGLAVRIWDHEGNRAAEFTGVRQIIKNYSCGSVVQPPTPACQPTTSEKAVSLYTQTAFGGSCKKFTDSSGNTQGTFFNSAALGTLSKAGVSIQTGSTSTCAVVFDQDNFNQWGRLETITASDANLANNRTGANAIASMWVGPCNNTPDDPLLTYPGNEVDPDGNSKTTPNPAHNPTAADSLVLAWTGAFNAVNFTSDLTKDGSNYLSMSKQNIQTWPVGNLPAGSYIWSVRGYAVGDTVGNGNSLTFTVDPGSLPEGSTTLTAPFTETMEAGEGGWVHSGSWRLASVVDQARGASTAWEFNRADTGIYADSTYRAGDLTSPVISIPSNGVYYLRFKQFSDVEGPLYNGQTFSERFFDQRRLQISIDGGAFTDLQSYTGDRQGFTQIGGQAYAVWMDSPVIKLGDFQANQTLRVRFHFDTVDSAHNSGLGWVVDDVSVNTTPPALCAGDNNDVPGGSGVTSLTVGGSAVSGVICSSLAGVGDVDYFKFSTAAGTPVKIDLNAQTLQPASTLDSFVDLLDSSGQNVLASNDDETPQVLQDSLITATLPGTGTNTYYIRVKDLNYPGAGGSGSTYTLRILQNTAIQPDSVQFTRPTDPKKLAVVPFTVAVDAQDTLGGGIRQVDFYWRSPDWVNSGWVKFATVTDSSNGWSATFDPSGKDIAGSAFYAMATNVSGGTRGALVTDLAPDLTTPVSEMLGLPASIQGTAVKLAWSASDVQNDISGFEFQYRLGTGSWTTWTPSVPISPGARSAWFVGAAGAYEFKMRAVDGAGHKEDWPASREVFTTLNAACTGDGYDSGDTSASQAANLPLSTLQQHRFCQGDVDWVKFTSDNSGNPYLLRILSVSGGASAHITLYGDVSTVSPLADIQAGGVGQSVDFAFQPESNHTYYLKIVPQNAGVYGQDVLYNVGVGPGNWAYLPSIFR